MIWQGSRNIFNLTLTNRILYCRLGMTVTTIANLILVRKPQRCNSTLSWLRSTCGAFFVEGYKDGSLKENQV